MTPAEIINAAKCDGVLVCLSDTGTIRAVGEQTAVNRWRSILQMNKAGIVNHLAVSPDPAPTLPIWCRLDCERYELLPGAGPGCLTRIDGGHYREAWRALATMDRCPKHPVKEDYHG